MQNLLTPRWRPLRPHAEQLRLINSPARFRVAAAGRRSGKTERGKRYGVLRALSETEWPDARFGFGAPTREQAKELFWEDLKKLVPPRFVARIREQHLSIELINGAVLQVCGLDKPQRIEGRPWNWWLIDEIDDCKPETWEESIRPTLSDRNGSAWFTGVPNGLGFLWDLKLKAEARRDWSYHWWKSADILSPQEIEDAKRDLDPRTFRQEYEASFETASGRIYEDYSDANCTAETIQPHEQLLWFHDFNFTPLSSGIGVRRNDELFILDEIILTSAVARQSAIEFVDRFAEHKNRSLLLFGDPAGKAGEKHGHASDYTEIETVLRQHGWKVTRNVRSAAPAIRDRQNAVRARVLNAQGERRLFVNPTKAPYSHRGLSTVQVKKGSTFQEEDGEYQHITTAIGYCVERLWPVRRGNGLEGVTY